ncbi:hypothetical protein QK294_20700 [Janthinobacterium tructae]|nr:HipA family kinase [Janthinobacterium tructae]MDI3296281.1 hypothetical protein [Janthinobacterium tructae]
MAEVAEELIEANAFPGISQLGSGIVFASRELPHPQELTAITRDLVPDQLASDVLVFDWWLHNEDRHLTERGGNPNLLWVMQNSGLVVIDHNQAFDRHFNPSNFLKTHVFASRWNDIFSDHLQREHYASKLGAILPRLAGIRAKLPGSWWYVDDGVPANVTWDEIETCLQRCRQEDFWNTP